MSLNVYSAINYNKNRGYSQQAIGIIQMFANARTTGVFDHQTVEAVYRTQQSPLYPTFSGGPDGKVGPNTLGLIIMELEHVSRMSDASVLKKYEYKINGVTYNKQSAPPPQPEQPEPAPKSEETIPLKDKDTPRPVLLHELQNMIMPSGTSIPNTVESKWTLYVGNLYLAAKDIRRILAGSYKEIIYMVVKTESDALDAFLVGKVYRETNFGFCSDVRNSWGRLVHENSKGGAEMAKKEVELLMGAVCAGVGAFGGFAAITASAMNVLLTNSKEIFKAADLIDELLKVNNVLSQYTPEFWTLCKTVLQLSLSKTHVAMRSDPYFSIRLAGELVMIVGEAVFLKRVRSFGFIVSIATKLMLGAFGKLTDAATLALAGKDLVAAMKEFDPTLDEARAQRVVKEIRDNWTIIEPAIKALKAILDQMVNAPQ